MEKKTIEVAGSYLTHHDELEQALSTLFSLFSAIRSLTKDPGKIDVDTVHGLTMAGLYAVEQAEASTKGLEPLIASWEQQQ